MRCFFRLLITTRLRFVLSLYRLFATSQSEFFVCVVVGKAVEVRSIVPHYARSGSPILLHLLHLAQMLSACVTLASMNETIITPGRLTPCLAVRVIYNEVHWGEHRLLKGKFSFTSTDRTDHG